MARVEFGADGIRGRANEWPLIGPVAVKIGQALGQFVRRRSEHPNVVIGRDTRPSGPELLYNLSAGLLGQGVDVINLRVMTTPGVAFLARRLHADLGVVVSASHSPYDRNGIKIVGPHGLRLQREEEMEIEALVADLLEHPAADAVVYGQETEGQHLIETYIQDHVERCAAQRLDGFRVVLDCANGAAARVAPEAFRRMGAEAVTINCAQEGTSINYQCGSDYALQDSSVLLGVMQQCGAQYGLSFDGDGDRLTVVDSGERVFDGNDLLFALARDFHARSLFRQRAVVTTAIANRGLEEALNAAGIQVVYTGKGDKNLEAAMWGGGYLLGGEPGGNLIINDGHHTAADAVYAALVLAGAMARAGEPGLAGLVAPLQKRQQVIVSFDVSAPLTIERQERLRDKVERVRAGLGEDSRILFWESTTESGRVRVMVEGGRKSARKEVLAAARAVRGAIRRATGTRGRVKG